MINNITNQSIIYGKLTKKPIKFGEAYQFAIVSPNPKSESINLWFDIETKDRRIVSFIKSLKIGSEIKCTCMLGNKIMPGKIITSLECFDVRLV